MMKNLFLIFISITISLSVEAQQMIARKAPFFYQLNSNEIWDFYQDKEGYIWIGTTNGLIRYDGHRLQSFGSNYKHPNLLASNSIVCMSDNDSYLWIGTRKGLNLFDKQTSRIISFPDNTLQNKSIDAIVMGGDKSAWIAAEGKIYRCNKDASVLKEYSLSSSGINSIYKDRAGNIWVLVSGKGIFKYDQRADKFINYPPIGKENKPFTMHQDRAGNYWIGTWGEGLWQFFPDNDTNRLYQRHRILSSKSKESDPIFYSLTQDDTFSYIWALSHNELYALRMSDAGTLEKVEIHNFLDTYMMYTRIFKDREGNLWLSSYDMPYTIYFDNSNIKNYPLPQIKERLGWDANILELCFDNDNLMWLNQDRHGLIVYDPSTNRMSQNQIEKYTGFLDVKDIARSRKDRGVWLGTNGTPRVMRLVSQDLKMQKAEDLNLKELTANPGSIEQLESDGGDNLWILTSTNLFLKPAGQKTIVTAKGKLSQMSKLTIDNQGTAWAIGRDGNIYQLSYSAGNVIYKPYTRIPSLLKNEEISHFCIDAKSSVWIITTLNRIYKSDKKGQHFDILSLSKQTDGSSIIYLLADKNYVWIVTNKKVIRYDINNGGTYDYQASDENICVNIFRYNAVASDRNGGIYVGGHGGFSHIQTTQQSSKNVVNNHPIVTDIKLNNASLFFSDSINADHRNTVNKVYLSAKDRNIEIFFSSLHYPLNSKGRFAYKLEGVDMEWIYLDTDKQSAFYNQLDKGDYRLWLKTEYEPGKWSKEEVVLEIHKTPAFYETWYAYLFYVVLAGLCVYLIFRVYLRRVRRKDAIRLQEELAQTKLDYFTNVSHELLTPLTVMSSAVDYLEMETPTNETQLNMLKSNISRLRRLIQQVLDFRKIDVDKLPLIVNYGNIGRFVLNICQTNFSSLAEKKNIDLRTHVPQKELWGYLDFDKVDKILFNLLSNAIKYSPNGAKIDVTVDVSDKDTNLLIIEVKDSGFGISLKDQEHIFSRFYRNKENSGGESNGIGLSLTRDMVNLHHGTISVQSVLDEGSCFTVQLPIDKESYQAEELKNDILETAIFDRQISEISPDKGDNIPTLLLVDDNAELLFLMTKTLENSFKVITASNGEMAWELLHNNEVDIAVCDVMMPDMNGWELCRRIKTDMRYSHIPVVILTARNADEDRIKTYEVGADGYIPKPFELKELYAQINNLIKLYKTRQDAFRKEQTTDLEGISYQSADKQFFQSVIQRIEEHLEKSDFDLEQLSSALDMSKSTLHRKIKSITGLTPLDFIRNIKMKRASMMLLDGKLTISEIAYAVGFNDPKYFTKCFKTEFGTTPSEYQQQQAK